jgi:hypothetical protein
MRIVTIRIQKVHPGDLVIATGGQVEPTIYKICVRGRLTERLGSAFAAHQMTVEPGESETALVGRMRDQSELYGVLDRVRDLGLELVSAAPAPQIAGR